MTIPADPREVFVETPARLHFGVLDLRGSRGRWFGGVGAAAPAPTLLVSASSTDGIEAVGEDAERAAGFARRFLTHCGIAGGARVMVHRALPPHVGLGSGTQLALAVARALAELYRIDAGVADLAAAVGRARRSAIGTWTFAGGGLIVEGGRRPEADGCGPLLARLPFPASWRSVIAVPHGFSAMSGLDEEAAFARLPPPPEREVEQVAHGVLLSLLPALAEGDVQGFGRALNELQAMTGRWFASVQGGVFSPGPTEELVRRMTEWGAPGVGQSSWGPAVFAIVGDEAAGRRLADRVRDLLGDRGRVYEGGFRPDSVRVWRA